VETLKNGNKFLLYIKGNINMVESSFVLWLVLVLGGGFLLYEGMDKKRIVFLILATILYSVSAFYSFSFVDIVGDAGVWVMIGLSLIGLVIGLVYTLYASVKLTKQKTLEEEW